MLIAIRELENYNKELYNYLYADDLYGRWEKSIKASGIPVLNTDTGTVRVVGLDYALRSKNILNIEKDTEGLWFCPILESFLCSSLCLGYWRNKNLLFFGGYEYFCYRLHTFTVEGNILYFEANYRGYMACYGDVLCFDDNSRVSGVVSNYNSFYRKMVMEG